MQFLHLTDCADSDQTSSYRALTVEQKSVIQVRAVMRPSALIGCRVHIEKDDGGHGAGE